MISCLTFSFSWTSMKGTKSDICQRSVKWYEQWRLIQQYPSQQKCTHYMWYGCYCTGRDLPFGFSAVSYDFNASTISISLLCFSSISSCVVLIGLYMVVDHASFNRKFFPACAKNTTFHLKQLNIHLNIGSFKELQLGSHWFRITVRIWTYGTSLTFWWVAIYYSFSW